LTVISGERHWARRRVRTEAVGAGRSTITYSLGWAKVPTMLAVVALFALALFGPLAVLGQWAMRGVQHGSQLHAERLLPALANTARFGVIGAILAVVVVLPIAYLSVRHPRATVARVSNMMITSAFAFPGLIIGFAFVNVAQVEWVPESLYLSTQLLIVAYVVHFGAQALRAAEVAVGGVPRRIGDAARALGASPLRRFFSIDVPLMRSGLAAGGGLVLLSIMKELPATLLLIPNEQDTLAIRIWSSAESLLYAQAGFFAIVLVAVSGVLTWLLTIRPIEREGRL
jgi:iron(III) transport system permease protein